MTRSCARMLRSMKGAWSTARTGRRLQVKKHMSHVTRHTSHATRHTSHVTRLTSHMKRLTSHVKRYTSHVTRHTPHVTRHTSRITLQATICALPAQTIASSYSTISSVALLRCTSLLIFHHKPVLIRALQDPTPSQTMVHSNNFNRYLAPFRLAMLASSYRPSPPLPLPLPPPPSLHIFRAVWDPKDTTESYVMCGRYIR
jgi:hypothetical protein